MRVCIISPQLIQCMSDLYSMHEEYYNTHYTNSSWRMEREGQMGRGGRGRLARQRGGVGEAEGEGRGGRSRGGGEWWEEQRRSGGVGGAEGEGRGGRGRGGGEW